MFKQMKKLLAIATLTLSFSGASHALTVGIFGDANTQAANVATGLGFTAVTLTDLSAPNLVNIDVLWGLNGNNGAQNANLVNFNTDVSNFVNGGGVFLYHDREVGTAETVLPGGGLIDIVRNVNTDTANIDVLNDVFGGVINNTTLDGGNLSSHGYANQGTLPAGALSIFSRTDPTQIVDFTYGFGSGSVYYSSIPLDFYLVSGGANANFASIYAPAVLGYVAGLAGQQIPEPAGIALLLAGLLGLRLSRLAKKA